MTISLKSQTGKTICGGRVDYMVNRESATTTIKFQNVKETTDFCATCPFKLLCPVERAHNNLKTIAVQAFTGMPIGELPIIKETAKQIEVQTKSGTKLRFDRQTGLQVNASNPKFANRINPADIPAYPAK